MVKLLMIADDFTGALDTGIQFAKRGIYTQVFTKFDFGQKDIRPETEVLVVDTESRPLSKEAAYAAVYEVADWAVRQQIGIILKKTDSALRGNIGAELQAAADAVGEGMLFFLPAHPAIDRVTRDGIHYIAGERLEDSVFGRDPFEPVKKSYVPDIIKEQSDFSVISLKSTEAVPDEENARIAVCDAASIEEIDRRLDELIRRRQLHCIAGCAGLADRLVEKLSFHRGKERSICRTDSFYVACGSLNQITAKQVAYAAEKGGFFCKRLTAEQKLNPAYYETEEGKHFLEEIADLCQSEKKLVVHTFDREEEKTRPFPEQEISLDEKRRRIAWSHGYIVRKLTERCPDMTVLLTGGDTLMGYMKQIGCTQLEPVCEIEPGAVVSMLEWGNHRQQVISKSGGFGTEDVFVRIAQKLLRGNG